MDTETPSGLTIKESCGTIHTAESHEDIFSLVIPVLLLDALNEYCPRDRRASEIKRFRAGTVLRILRRYRELAGWQFRQWTPNAPDPIGVYVEPSRKLWAAQVAYVMADLERKDAPVRLRSLEYEAIAAYLDADDLAHDLAAQIKNISHEHGRAYRYSSRRAELTAIMATHTRERETARREASRWWHRAACQGALIWLGQEFYRCALADASFWGLDG